MVLSGNFSKFSHFHSKQNVASSGKQHFLAWSWNHRTTQRCELAERNSIPLNWRRVSFIYFEFLKAPATVLYKTIFYLRINYNVTKAFFTPYKPTQRNWHVTFPATNYV
jgi:hypothetical protein